MKQVTLALFFLLTTLLCFGQKEHLEPAKDFNQYEGVLKVYYDNVFPLLYNEFSQKPYARYTSMPSFSAEYAFSVEENDGKYYVISNNLSENYWYAKNKKSVKIIANKTEINQDLYLKIGELFHLLAEQTKKIEKDMFGLDGVTYYFATTDKNGEIRIGETWSPNKGTLLNKLVKVCDNLSSIGIKKNTSQTGILKEIETLINDLKQ
jgi:hypothetical protein